MSQVVVISGHPNLEESYTNSVVLEQLHTSLSDVDVRRLDTLYPDYQIDVHAEQQALLDAEVIVLQFPFYWYSVPALLKKWIDDVLTFNFAYGPEGDKLKGKSLFLSFTVGGPEESYQPLGYNHFSIEQMLRPLEQTAYLAGMTFRTPVYTHRMVYIPDVYNTQEEVQGRAKQHADRLIEQIRSVTESAEEQLRAFVGSWFAEFDQLAENTHFFKQHLDEQVNWRMPEGNFSGHQGFDDWYALARKTFKPDCKHQVEQIDVSQTDDGYQLDLRIRLFADTYEDSPLAGESINLLVNETWQVEIDQTGHITIYDYRVIPVNSSN